MFDPGNSGRMETKDLGTAVRSLGQNPSEVQIKEMIKDADRRGYVTLFFFTCFYM